MRQYGITIIDAGQQEASGITGHAAGVIGCVLQRKTNHVLITITLTYAGTVYFTIVIEQYPSHFRRCDAGIDSDSSLICICASKSIRVGIGQRLCSGIRIKLISADNTDTGQVPPDGVPFKVIFGSFVQAGP